ncbi:MAG: hypothetical protein CL561_00415 [Alphaproteobacteria bacterium]|nr:hypothetical protein [Alphaproteobacteria bacterium]|tara:strand:+ start:27439 stop:27771 length:333 start_codon:yes stop_codon:yes gene_type:complete
MIGILGILKSFKYWRFIGAGIGAFLSVLFCLYFIHTVQQNAVLKGEIKQLEANIKATAEAYKIKHESELKIERETARLLGKLEGTEDHENGDVAPVLRRAIDGLRHIERK